MFPNRNIGVWRVLPECNGVVGRQGGRGPSWLWYVAMRTEELDFYLPQELIAQHPAERRGASRLFHYRRSDEAIWHRGFADLPGLLKRGDVLVFNDSRVIPARLALRKATGGRIDGLFLAETEPGVWEVLLRNVGGMAAGSELVFAGDEGVRLAMHELLGEGRWRVRLSTGEGAMEVLGRLGRMPLPPYIKRDKERDEADEEDRERYQTVYARQATSVAAPTAGLHFTPEVLAELDERGVERVCVTLDVGIGTFKPVTAETLAGHDMHSETFHVSPEAAERLNGARRDGKRVIAVGTTSARVLESMEPGVIKAGRGETRILIYPPYEWRNVQGLITNFHLPRSTLIALVAAWVGVAGQRRIYAEAVERGYRFFSYGDSSFLE
jgi:S-adenosylmethionine:tRNA ribosyltransferase-isomerase